MVLPRRSALRLLLGGAALATFDTACVPAAPAPPTTLTTRSAPTEAAPAPAGGQTPSGGEPRRGGTLRSAVVGDPPGLEVHVLLPSLYETVWLVYDRLISYDDKLVPQPQLAESWDVNADATQIKLNLRKDVQFHSGREFTSDDVKYNLLRVRDPKIGAGTFVNQSNWFSTIETPEKYSVVLKSDTPRPLTFDLLEYFNIVDKEAMESADARGKAVGTG